MLIGTTSCTHHVCYRNHPTIHSHPPVSECLRRRLARQAKFNPDNRNLRYFVVPYTPLSRVVPTRQIISHHWWILSPRDQRYHPTTDHRLSESSISDGSACIREGQTR